MFTKEELVLISSGLLVQRQSMIRLAARVGQLPAVADQYRLQALALERVLAKVQAEMAKK